MFYFAFFIFFTGLPLIIAGMIGVKGAFKCFFMYTLIILLVTLGFGVGLSWKWLVESSAYWQTYSAPESWTLNYKRNHFDHQGPLIQVFVIPYLALADCIRFYVHFNIEKGGLALWIPEIASFVTIRNFLVIFYPSLR